MNVKKKLNITWPTTHFTIKDITDSYPDAKEITLRFRINKAAENNEIVYIGKNETKVGRPTIVFAPFPVADSILKDAEASGVILDERFQEKLKTHTVATVAKTESVDAEASAATIESPVAEDSVNLSKVTEEV
jgi:hypothetical protein